MKKALAYTLFSLFSLPFCAMAQDQLALNGDLENTSLESLGNIVTSVSKKPEDSFRSPAAIYVITNEDIKLSGATHIAEVLRGVPGLDVARFDSSNWAIASRGFNGFFTDKLLVLVDGRTIYTPLFAGVYWDIQNMPLEDIERIEVIRGPGAALWGSNAVNGVINIITKSAADTQGLYASTLAGNQDRSITDVRYGGKIGDDGYYRTYAKYDDRAQTKTNTGADGDNNWDNAKTGFRSDWTPTSTSKATFQGDIYAASINLDLLIPTITPPNFSNFYHDRINSQGGNLLGRWTEEHSDTLQSTFQAYFDFQSPSYSSFGQQIWTTDLDYQTSWKANDRNDVLWGAGARYIGDELQSTSDIYVTDPKRAETIFSAFIQDQYALIQKELYLTVGSKFEENSFVGFVPEPSVRIAWYPNSKQTVWAAVSHAVRTPTIQEEGINLNLFSVPPSTMVSENGTNSVKSEELNAYEIGYRIKPMQTISIDTTAFINDYQKLRTLEPGPVVVTPTETFAPYMFSQLGKGRAYGFEASATWDVTSRWDLRANYSYINLVLDQGASQDPIFLSQQGQTPHNQFSARSRVYLPYDVQMVDTVYYVDKLPAENISGYLRFDTQFIWQATPGLEFALVGQNLLQNQHPEQNAALDGFENEIPRAYYAKVTVRY